MKKNKKTIVHLVAAILFSYGFMIIMSLVHQVNPINLETPVFGTTALFTVLSISYLFRKIVDNNSKKSVAQLKQRLIPSFILSLLAVTFIALFFYFAGNYVFYLIHGQTGSFKAITSLSRAATLSLLGGLFVCCVVFFYATWLQAIEREQKLREENLRYRYGTLKAQINPHFLFNSLNTLSEIVYADACKADHYIQKLAGVYRFILDNEETDLVPLEEELAFAEQYFSLQKKRYGDKIDLDMAVENADRLKIIPVSLQILIENALKHNASSEENPLKIMVSVNNGVVIVSNNIQRKTILNDSSGTGLLNLKTRVKLLMNKEMVISQTNGQFTVKLPIIEIEK